VVEAPDPGKCDDFARARRFGSARDRRIALERHVRSIFVAISDVLADRPEQMPLPNPGSRRACSRSAVDLPTQIHRLTLHGPQPLTRTSVDKRRVPRYGTPP
jgi:hypothetical protein